MFTHEMRTALDEAKATFRACDNMANDFAAMIAWRLRSGKVSGTHLEALKKELTNYNIHTGKWKNDHTD